MFHKGPSDKDVLQFFKIISRHYKAERPIVDCVEAYIKSTDNDEMRNVCKGIHHAMVNGSDFAPALEKAPKVFKPFIIQFIRVGEKNHLLDQFIEKIINQLKQNISIHNKISRATLMPKISMAILVVAFIFLIYYLMPKFVEVFNQVKIDLPFITRVFIGIGGFFQTFWWILPLSFFMIVVAFKYYKEKYPIEYSLLGLRIPFYKDIAYYKIHYNFCEIFALCLGSGLKSLSALQHVALAIDNAYMSKMLRNAAVLMERGNPLSKAIQKSDVEHILNSGIFSMLETGEETNKTADVLKNEAEFYLDDLDEAMEGISDKVSASVMVPIFSVMIIFFGVMEYPMKQLQNNLGALGKGIGQ